MKRAVAIDIDIADFTATVKSIPPNDRDDAEYYLWRKSVLEGDSFICKFDVENGLTLCRKCHIKEHQKIRKQRGAKNGKG